jgi:hypothetical protein
MSSGIRTLQGCAQRPSQNCVQRFLLVDSRAARIFNRLGSLLDKPAGFIDQSRSDYFALKKTFD